MSDNGQYCESCEVMFINGIKCHEFGCPDAWKEEVRSCLECGTEFTPESCDQLFCDVSCSHSYYS